MSPHSLSAECVPFPFAPLTGNWSPPDHDHPSLLRLLAPIQQPPHPPSSIDRSKMGKILFAGNCCLDIVTYLREYPAEDSDNRNVDQLFTLGGNATNSSKVVVQLAGAGSTQLFSAIPDQNALFDGLFARYGLDTSLCVVRRHTDAHSSEDVPMCVCLVNEQNGSRTMFSSLRNKRWPTADEFRARFPDSLIGFSWFHFETGSTIKEDEIAEMVRHVHTIRKGASVVISIEFEHAIDEKAQKALIPLGDVFFLSKDFAKDQGWYSMRECVTNFQERFCAHHATVICPWGEKGVAAKSGTSLLGSSGDGNIIEVHGHTPSSGVVVDTLAAGDCFIAGVVHFLNVGDGLRRALEKATILAGESVGQRGLYGLKLP